CDDGGRLIGTAGASDGQGYGIGANVTVLMRRLPITAGRTIAEVPGPGADQAGALVGEAHRPARRQVDAIRSESRIRGLSRRTDDNRPGCSRGLATAARHAQ